PDGSRFQVRFRPARRRPSAKHGGVQPPEPSMRHASSAFAIAALCACSNPTDVTRPTAIEAKKTSNISYHVVKFSSSLGGTLNRGLGINNQGWVAGFSNLAGDGTRHAALWQNGTITDLKTLGGPSSTVPWPGLNNNGMIVGISQTADVDPLDE